MDFFVYSAIYWSSSGKMDSLSEPLGELNLGHFTGTKQINWAIYKTLIC